MTSLSDAGHRHNDSVEMVVQSKGSEHHLGSDFTKDAEVTEQYLETQHFDGIGSTSNDAQNMRRMGKDQQLIRSFRLLSVSSFVALTTVSWEYGVFTLGPGLQNGGRSGLIYSTLWSFVGFGPVYLSMAEMASMAPIAGAQYHWVSEFAPESCQKVLSYLIG